jgi:anti-sigma B factor antagonist
MLNCMKDEGSGDRHRSGPSASRPFNVASRTEEGWAVFDVQGDLDVYSSAGLRHQILDRIDKGDTRIIVDLEHVDFLDSTGVSVMVSGLRLASNSNGTLVLVQPGDQVQRMLKLTNLDKVLHAFASVESAVSFGGGAGSEPEETATEGAAT